MQQGNELTSVAISMAGIHCATPPLFPMKSLLVRSTFRVTIHPLRLKQLQPTPKMKFSSIALAAVAIASSSVNGFSSPARFGVRQNMALQMSTAIEADTKIALATAANEARGLAMDSIAAAHSGHMGLPLGAAEIGAVLYGSQVSIFLVDVNDFPTIQNLNQVFCLR
jgi:Transketolase, thiamine diphosphate binding domain